MKTENHSQDCLGEYHVDSNKGSNTHSSALPDDKISEIDKLIEETDRKFPRVGNAKIYSSAVMNYEIRQVIEQCKEIMETELNKCEKVWFKKYRDKANEVNRLMKREELKEKIKGLRNPVCNMRNNTEKKMRIAIIKYFEEEDKIFSGEKE